MKKFFKFFGIGLGVLIICFIFLYFILVVFSKDEVLLNYKNLIPERIKVDESQNGLALLIEFKNKITNQNDFAEIEMIEFLRIGEKIIKNGKELDLDYVKNYLADNKQVLPLIKKISESPYFFSEIYTDLDSANLIDDISRLSDFYAGRIPSSLIRFLNIKVLFELQNGNNTEATNDLETLLTIMNKLSISVDSLLVGSVFYALFDESFDTVTYVLSSSKIDQDNRKVLVDKISSLKIDPKFMCEQAIKFDTIYFINTVDRVKFEYSHHILTDFWDGFLRRISFYFKPNKTKNFYIKQATAVLNGDTFSSDVIENLAKKYNSKWDLLSHENSFGDVLLLMMYPSMDCWDKAEKFVEKLKKMQSLVEGYTKIGR